MNESGDIRVDLIMPKLCHSWRTMPFEECLLNKGTGFKKLKSKEIKPAGNIPVVDQGEKFVVGYTDNKSHAYTGPLPVIIFGDHTRRVKYIDFTFAVGADGTKLLHPIDALHPRFFFYYLRSLNLESQGYSRHYRFLKKIDVPIPPLNEQRCIVIKLEKLLHKIDACNERLEKIPVILKRFRQSVLSAACSGRLTADWREKNPDVKHAAKFLKKITYDKVTCAKDENLPSTWCLSELRHFIESMANGIYKPEKYYTSDGVISLRMYNIQDGKIIWQNLKRMSLTKHEVEQYRLKEGDILVNRVNSRELVGKAAIIQNLKEHVIFESKNIRLRLVKNSILPEYVNYCFMTRIVRDVFEDKSKQTVGMATISQPQIASLQLPIPPLLEQKEVVRRVEALFKKADEIEERYKKAKVFVDRLTQSILAKAFRGELVPRDPDEEPASVLLERIREAKEKAIVTGKQTRRRKSIRSS